MYSLIKEKNQRGRGGVGGGSHQMEINIYNLGGSNDQKFKFQLQIKQQNLEKKIKEMDRNTYHLVNYQDDLLHGQNLEFAGIVALTPAKSSNAHFIIVTVRGVQFFIKLNTKVAAQNQTQKIKTTTNQRKGILSSIWDKFAKNQSNKVPQDAQKIASEILINKEFFIVQIKYPPSFIPLRQRQQMSKDGLAVDKDLYTITSSPNSTNIRKILSIKPNERGFVARCLIDQITNGVVYRLKRSASYNMGLQDGIKDNQTIFKSKRRGISLQRNSNFQMNKQQDQLSHSPQSNQLSSSHIVNFSIDDNQLNSFNLQRSKIYQNEKVVEIDDNKNKSDIVSLINSQQPRLSGGFLYDDDDDDDDDDDQYDESLNLQQQHQEIIAYSTGKIDQNLASMKLKDSIRPKRTAARDDYTDDLDGLQFKLQNEDIALNCSQIQEFNNLHCPPTFVSTLTQASLKISIKRRQIDIVAQLLDQLAKGKTKNQDIDNMREALGDVNLCSLILEIIMKGKHQKYYLIKELSYLHLDNFSLSNADKQPASLIQSIVSNHNLKKKNKPITSKKSQLNAIYMSLQPQAYIQGQELFFKIIRRNPFKSEFVCQDKVQKQILGEGVKSSEKPRTPYSINTQAILLATARILKPIWQIKLFQSISSTIGSHNDSNQHLIFTSNGNAFKYFISHLKQLLHFISHNNPRLISESQYHQNKGIQIIEKIQEFTKFIFQQLEFFRIYQIQDDYRGFYKLINLSPMAKHSLQMHTLKSFSLIVKGRDVYEKLIHAYLDQDNGWEQPERQTWLIDLSNHCPFICSRASILLQKYYTLLKSTRTRYEKIKSLQYRDNNDHQQKKAVLDITKKILKKQNNYFNTNTDKMNSIFRLAVLQVDPKFIAWNYIKISDGQKLLELIDILIHVLQIERFKFYNGYVIPDVDDDDNDMHNSQDILSSSSSSIRTKNNNKFSNFIDKLRNKNGLEQKMNKSSTYLENQFKKNVLNQQSQAIFQSPNLPIDEAGNIFCSDLNLDVPSYSSQNFINENQFNNIGQLKYCERRVHDVLEMMTLSYLILKRQAILHSKRSLSPTYFYPQLNMDEINQLRINLIKKFCFIAENDDFPQIIGHLYRLIMLDKRFYSDVVQLSNSNAIKQLVIRQSKMLGGNIVMHAQKLQFLADCLLLKDEEAQAIKLALVVGKMDQSKKFGENYVTDVKDLIFVEQRLSIVSKVEEYVEKNLKEIMNRQDLFRSQNRDQDEVEERKTKIDQKNKEGQKNDDNAIQNKNISKSWVKDSEVIKRMRVIAQEKRMAVQEVHELKKLAFQLKIQAYAKNCLIQLHKQLMKLQGSDRQQSSQVLEAIQSLDRRKQLQLDDNLDVLEKFNLYEESIRLSIIILGGDGGRGGESGVKIEDKQFIELKDRDRVASNYQKVIALSFITHPLRAEKDLQSTLSSLKQESKSNKKLFPLSVIINAYEHEQLKRLKRENKSEKSTHILLTSLGNKDEDQKNFWIFELFADELANFDTIFNLFEIYTLLGKKFNKNNDVRVHQYILAKKIALFFEMIQGLKGSGQSQVFLKNEQRLEQITYALIESLDDEDLLLQLNQESKMKLQRLQSLIKKRFKMRKSEATTLIMRSKRSNLYKEQ